MPAGAVVVPASTCQVGRTAQAVEHTQPNGKSSAGDGGRCWHCAVRCQGNERTGRLLATLSSSRPHSPI